MVLMVMFGEMLEKKVDEIALEVETVQEVLEGDSQAMWTVLHCSLAQKFDWHLSLCYPSDILATASRLDTILWSMLERAARLHIPKGEEGGRVECVLEVAGVESLR